MARELDEFSGYFTVFPRNWKDKDAPQDEPYLCIDEDCPKDIKERLLKKWEQVYKDTIERQMNGVITSNDYFVYSKSFDIESVKAYTNKGKEKHVK